MSKTWLRVAQGLEYRNPGPFLISLRKLELEVAASALPERVRQLRTNPLREWKEAREAALFCYGMGQRISATVCFAKGEAQHYDFVAAWRDGGRQHFARVQLKEIVPVDINPSASLQRTLLSLAKYTDSKDLTVAIYLNQFQHFDPTTVILPALGVGEIWAFGSITLDQSRWALWGDFLGNPQGTEFAYPGEAA